MKRDFKLKYVFLIVGFELIIGSFVIVALTGNPWAASVSALAAFIPGLLYRMCVDGEKWDRINDRTRKWLAELKEETAQRLTDAGYPELARRVDVG